MAVAIGIAFLLVGGATVAVIAIVALSPLALGLSRPRGRTAVAGRQPFV